MTTWSPIAQQRYGSHFPSEGACYDAIERTGSASKRNFGTGETCFPDPEPPKIISPSESLANVQKEVATGGGLDVALSSLTKIDFKKLFEGQGGAIVGMVIAGIVLAIILGRK